VTPLGCKRGKCRGEILPFTKCSCPRHDDIFIQAPGRNRIGAQHGEGRVIFRECGCQTTITLTGDEKQSF